MKLLGALPALKVAGVIAVAVAFAGAIAFGASRDNGPRDFAQQSTVPTPARVPERTPTPFTGRHFPTPTPRSVVPGLDRGGLFADGMTNLVKNDTSTWLTYTNAQWGFSFKYPAELGSGGARIAPGF